MLAIVEGVGVLDSSNRESSARALYKLPYASAKLPFVGYDRVSALPATVSIQDNGIPSRTIRKASPLQFIIIKMKWNFWVLLVRSAYSLFTFIVCCNFPLIRAVKSTSGSLHRFSTSNAKAFSTRRFPFLESLKYVKAFLNKEVNHNPSSRLPYMPRDGCHLVKLTQYFCADPSQFEIELHFCLL